MKLVSLQLKTTNDFEYNLSRVIRDIKRAPSNSIILANELVLTGYDYDRLKEASLFTYRAIEEIRALSNKENEKIISLTMIIKKENHYFNTLFVFYNNKIIHKQSKNRLFNLNDEDKFLSRGNIKDIKIFEINGLKIGALICFELRFIDLWQKLQGADIILIPAMWGKSRRDNLKALTKSLAIINQCFVLVSNSANSDMAKGSGVITPFGEEFRDDRKEIIIREIDLKEITKMRRYLDIGLDKGLISDNS